MLVNPGANRRTGPDRMWTEVARRSAARGIPSVRFDLEGLGDSDGDGALYAGGQWFYDSPHLNDLYRGVLTRLQETGFAHDFIAVGLCSGAYQGLHAALADRNVRGGVFINLFTFEWSQPLLDQRERRENLRRARGHLPAVVRRPPRLNRARLRWMWHAAKVTARSRIRGSAEAAQARSARRMFATLREYGTEVHFLFSETEPVYDELERQGVLDELARWPNITVERLPTSDHVIRALPIQTLVHAKIDRTIDSIRRRIDDPGAGTAPASRATERGVMPLSG